MSVCATKNEQGRVLSNPTFIAPIFPTILAGGWKGGPNAPYNVRESTDTLSAIISVFNAHMRVGANIILRTYRNPLHWVLKRGDRVSVADRMKAQDKERTWDRVGGWDMVWEEDDRETLLLRACLHQGCEAIASSGLLLPVAQCGF